MLNLENLQLNYFIAIDVETTGLDLYNDKIIEVAAVKFENGQIKDTFTELINPDKKIPYFIENLTGISNADVINKSSFVDISDDFIDFIDGYPIVGHNIKFDIDFINKELNNKYNLYSSIYICDTFYLSQIFLYGSNSYKLQSLCNDFSIDINKAHRAEDDAEITGKLFLKILDTMKNFSLNDFNGIYKVYNEDIIFNRKLFEYLIGTYVEDSFFEDKLISDSKMLSDCNILSFESEENIENVELDSIFHDGGLLDQNIEKYQYRPSQMQFSEFVKESIDEDSILIAEAETGLGKTYGYLIPSLLNKDKKVVVSTSTHNLQEQIFSKDLPVIGNVLKKNIKAVIIKGMRNYICQSRLEHLINNIDVLTKSEKLDLLPVVIWSKYTKTGDISECNGFRLWKNKKIWDLICYDHDFCGVNKANDHEECFYQTLKKHIVDSNLLIINHSLLASCYEKQDSIVDDCDICIIDEAHKFAENCRMQMNAVLNKNILKGIFDSYNFILDKILNNNVNHQEFQTLYDDSKYIAGNFTNFLNDFNDMSYSFSSLKFSNNRLYNNTQDIRYKCSEKVMVDIDPHFDIIKQSYQDLVKLVNDNNKVINNLDLDNYTNLQKIDLTISLNKIVDLGLIINNMFSDIHNHVNWATIKSNNGNINSVSFNVSPLGINDIFIDISSKFNSLILTSATLTVDDSFDYIFNEIGLDNYLINKKVVTEKFYSPFAVKDQIKLFINDSYVDINSSEFIESTYEVIYKLKQNLNKRMLVLCTSYKQISDFKKICNDDSMLFQEISSSKKILLDKYLKVKNSVLFGTSSFWEGVDLPADKLEVLFIIKLPFSNPYNPIVQAKIESYLDKNLDPFMDYQLSESILKLRQGIGRLIRRQEDMGICVLADPRILKKRYGKNIVDALPIDYISYNNYSKILNNTENFFRD